MAECLRKKMIGKPYSGEPTVRFDEGELETHLTAIVPSRCVHRKVQKRLQAGRQFSTLPTPCEAWHLVRMGENVLTGWA
jgi:hypothetical protein